MNILHVLYQQLHMEVNCILLLIKYEVRMMTNTDNVESSLLILFY